MRNTSRSLRLIALLLATASLTACSLERLTGTKPKAACQTRSYTDTVRISLDTIAAPLSVRIGGCGTSGA